MEESGGEAVSTRQSVASNSQSWSTDACQKMAGKLVGLTAKQRDLQRFLSSLASEQEAFLEEMRMFSDVGQLGEPSAVRTFPGCRISTNSGHLRDSVATFPGPRISTNSGHLRDSAAKSFQAKSSEQPARKVPVGPSDAPDFASESVPSGGGRDPSTDFARSTTLSADSGQLRTSTSRKTLRPMPSSLHADGVTMSTAHLKAELTHLYSNVGSSRKAASGWINKARFFSTEILESQYFEVTMCLIILINVVNIGWAIEAELRKQDTSVQTIIEIVILVLFWVELFLIFLVHGFGALKQKWNIFDLTINLVTTLVLIMVAVADAEWRGNTLAEVMNKMITLRMVRLLRLFRATRIIRMSKHLWMLVQGLKQSVGTVIAALVLICIALYVFACFGAELITKSYTGDAVVGRMIDRNMSSIPRIMLTLFQFISMDSTAEIYVNLVLRDPRLMIYFLLLVVVVAVMLMNLITAVIVEDAITSATMDKDLKGHVLREKLKGCRPAFAELFNNIDFDCDGTVHIKDIVTAINDGLKIPEVIQDLVTPPRMLDLFDLLDQDNSGELTESEFVDGMSCLALSEVPLETMQILHLLRLLRREVSGLLHAQGFDGFHSEEDLDGDEGPRTASLVLREDI